MKQIDPLDPRFVRAMSRGFERRGYGSVSVKSTAVADRQTREAEEQDIYGLASPVLVERVADEDRTLTGGYLNEEVVGVLRGEPARHADVLEAARAFNTPWLLDETSLPRE